MPARSSRRGAPGVRVAAAKARAKQRRVDGRPPLSLSAAPASSSVRFLDSGDHAQHQRARFVPDTTSEDEACADDLPARAPAAAARRRPRRRPHEPTHRSSAPVGAQQASRKRLQPPIEPQEQPALRLDGPATPTSVGPVVLRPPASWASSSRRRSAGGASELEQRRLLSASTYSTASRVEDAALLARARLAKRQLEAAAKRQVMVGRWKPLLRATHDCQAFDSRGAAGDAYSVVARLNLPCSLREIMGVLATDKADEFHRSMEALFGDLYVYGVGLRAVDCGSVAAGGRPSRLRSSLPAAYAPALRTTKLSLNAVSLLQRRGLFWKPRSMCFLDLLEEKMDDKAVLRVLQTLDEPGDGGRDKPSGGGGGGDDDDPSSVSMSSPTAGSSSRHTQPPPPPPGARPGGPDGQRELRGLSVGYILQEDSEEKFTRLFFYARAERSSGARAVSPSAVQLLRAMAAKACALEAVVTRRRLGRCCPLTPDPPARTAAYCAVCYMPFSLLRKKRQCRLCGRHTCRKCSSVQDVEKAVGEIEQLRVCSGCVRRAGYYAFAAGAPTKAVKAATTETSSSALDASQSRSRSRSQVAGEDDAPPILEDLAATAVEDIATLNPDAGDVRAYVKSLLPSKARRGGGRQVEEQEDVDAWMDDVEPLPGGRATPRESITLLGCADASDSASDSSRDVRPWYPASPPAMTRSLSPPASPS